MTNTTSPDLFVVSEARNSAPLEHQHNETEENRNGKQQDKKRKLKGGETEDSEGEIEKTSEYTKRLKQIKYEGGQFTIFPEEFHYFQKLNDYEVIRTPIYQISDKCTEKVHLDKLVEHLESISVKQAFDAVNTLLDMYVQDEVTAMNIPDLMNLIQFWQYSFTADYFQQRMQFRQRNWFLHASWKQYIKAYLNHDHRRRCNFSVRAWTLLLAYCWRKPVFYTRNNAQQSSATSASVPVPTSSRQTSTTNSPSTSSATVNESHIGVASGSGGTVETKKSIKLNSSFVSINEKGRRSVHQSDACSGDYLIDMRIYSKADLSRTGDLEDFSRLACTHMNLWCQEKEICFLVAKNLERKAIDHISKDPSCRICDYRI